METWLFSYTGKKIKDLKVFKGEIILALKKNFKIGVHKAKYMEPQHILMGQYNPSF